MPFLQQDLEQSREVAFGGILYANGMPLRAGEDARRAGEGENDVFYFLSFKKH